MRLAARDWLDFVLPGDWLALACAGAVVVALGMHFWRADKPDRLEVRAGGQLFATLPLDRPATLDVPGPLGLTRIQIEAGRARVVSDPGPRQYCVRQGWLAHNGAVAICAPNQVSIALAGRAPVYDSLGY